MSGGMNQQYPPMGGGMGAGGQGGMKPIGTYTSNDSWIPEGSPQFEGGGPIGQPTFGVGMPGGGGWGGGPPRFASPGYITGGPDDPEMGGSGYMTRPGMGGGQGGGSWNGPAPPGFTHGGGPSTMALEEFINPTTGQTWTASHGGYQPPPGWQRVGGPGFSANPGGGLGHSPGMGVIGGGQGDPNRPVPYRPPHIAQPPRDRWAGLGQGFSQDQFWKAKSFADRGKMGRAKQAIMQGGGQWSPQLHGLLSSPSGRWGNMGWDTMA